MKIKAPSRRRILFEGEDMFLTEYCDDSNMWFWKIIGEKPCLIEKGFKEQGTLYTLSFPKKGNILIPPMKVACIAFTWGTSMKLRIYGMDYSYYPPTNVKREDTLS